MDIRPGHSRLRVAYCAGTMRPGHDGVTRVLYRLIDALVETGIESIFFSPIIPPAGSQPVPMFEVPSVRFPLYREYRFALPGQKHFEATLAAALSFAWEQSWERIFDRLFAGYVDLASGGRNRRRKAA